MDCTILWKTKDKKGKSLDAESTDIDDIHFIWITKNNEISYRVQNTMKWVEDTVKVPISLMASIVLLIGGIIAYQSWRCWNQIEHRVNQQRGGLEGFGYFKILDLETDSVWTNQMRNGYGACSKDSEHDSNHYQTL